MIKSPAKNILRGKFAQDVFLIFKENKFNVKFCKMPEHFCNGRFHAARQDHAGNMGTAGKDFSPDFRNEGANCDLRQSGTAIKRF